MFKKITVLAMAVGVLAAIALPTSAPANFKHHATDLQQSVTLNFTGNARFQGGLGGVECQVTGELLFKPGTTGTVEGFTTDTGTETEKCKGLGGLAFCQVHNLTPQMPQWVFHTVTVAGQSRLQVTHGDIVSQLTGGFCPVKKVTLTEPAGLNDSTLTPNQPNTFTSGQLSGQLQADLETSSGTVDKETVTVSGSAEVKNTATEGHTYSI